MRAVLAPYNFAGQPVLIARSLRERGIDAEHLLYAWRWGAGFRYPPDRVVDLNRANWLKVQLGVVEEVIARRPDVVHLWNRSLVTPPDGTGLFSGMDLPYLRAA